MTTDAKITAVLSQLVANERHHEGVVASGQPYEHLEEDRNDKRADLEAELFSIPASGMRGIAAKLRALWPDLTALMRDGVCKPCADYSEAPNDDADRAVHRLWTLISEAEKLADEEERKHAKPSTTGLIDYYKEQVEKDGR